MYSDDFTDPERKDIPPCWAADISNTPTASGQDVFVRINGIDGGKKQWGPCRWSPQVNDAGAAAFPAEGDTALVVKDDDGEYWILMWWTYG